MSDLHENKIQADTELDKKFDNEINLLGRVTSIIALALMFSVPFIIMLRFGIPVKVGETLSVWGSLFALFAPAAVIENISYYAIIGAGAVYLCSITGNVANMKLPAAVSGMKIADAEPGSRKGDIISILSVASSSIVTVTILFLSMLVIGRFLTPILSHPVLAPGFANIMPSLLGAMIVPFVLKNPKLCVVPFVVSIAICLIMGVAFVQRYTSFLLIPVIFISALAAYFMYKRGMFAKKPATKNGG
jgi:hypothetical protein